MHIVAVPYHLGHIFSDIVNSDDVGSNFNQILFN